MVFHRVQCRHPDIATDFCGALMIQSGTFRHTEHLGNLSRRRILAQAGAGFGLLALTSLVGNHANGSSRLKQRALSQITARAKRVIFLFMNGAPSHVDTFDPKPALSKYEGQQPTQKVYRKKVTSGFVPSPFSFRAHGASGVVMSELFPRLAHCADDLCVLRSMHTDVPNHEPGLLMMNSGNQQPIRPSMGSWLSYGLGSENEESTGFRGDLPWAPSCWSTALVQCIFCLASIKGQPLIRTTPRLTSCLPICGTPRCHEHSSGASSIC